MPIVAHVKPVTTTTKCSNYRSKPIMGELLQNELLHFYCWSLLKRGFPWRLTKSQIRHFEP